MEFDFHLLHTDGHARRGRIVTPRGVIETPIFMPVGTRATVKALGPDDLERCDAEIILSNTYHLMLRPGSELIANMGGLHKFMSWKKPILTDSGGFQVFSLAHGSARGADKDSGNSGQLVKIDDDGVSFRSYIDGSKYRVTPESCMQIQMQIGADFIMAFDQCPQGQSTRDAVQQAMDRTSAWLKRCNEAMNSSQSRLLGIIQGGIYEDLRKEHAQEICSNNLFGYAIGGLSVGEAKEDMWPACFAATSNMPANKPRYLMGVGTPDDLLDGIALGVDMFDCVMPARNARNGTLFCTHEKISIKAQKHKEDNNPIDAECDCYTCNNFSRSYLRHLYLCDELLFYRLATIHNVRHYTRLMRDARKAIENKEFASFRKSRKLEPDLL